MKYLNELRRKKKQLQDLIDAGGECGINVKCYDCPLSMVTKRSDGSWTSCAAAVAEYVGVKGTDAVWNIGAAEWVKLAVKLLCDLEVEEMLLSDQARKEDLI